MEIVEPAITVEIIQVIHKRLLKTLDCHIHYDNNELGRCHEIKVTLNELILIDRLNTMEIVYKIAEEYSSEKDNWLIAVEFSEDFLIMAVDIVDEEGIKESTLREAIASLVQTRRKIKGITPDQ